MICFVFVCFGFWIRNNLFFLLDNCCNIKYIRFDKKLYIYIYVIGILFEYICIVYKNVKI